MENPMPVPVKKLLADLIEIYSIYGEMLYLFNQKEVNPIYIIQLDELFENRILDPLAEVESLRKKLPVHFEEIKYQCQDFNFQFQSEIYETTSNLQDLFLATFKDKTRIEIYKSLPANFKEIGKLMNMFPNQIKAYAGFFNELEVNANRKTLDIFHSKLKDPSKKELPAFAGQAIRKFIPTDVEFDIETLLKYANNRAVVVIFSRLFQFEPWKTITNPEAYQKLLGNIEGPDDERYKKIFGSPAALQSLHALKFTKEQEEKLFLGNREFAEGIFFLLNCNHTVANYTLKRNLIRLFLGDIAAYNLFFHEPQVNHI